MYQIASFDIGIRNLGMCIIEKTDNFPYFMIKDWENISLVSQINRTLICSQLLKSKKVVTKTKTGKTKIKDVKCSSKAIYWNPLIKKGYCKKHNDINKDENYVRYTTTKNVTDFELNCNIIKYLDSRPKLWLECDEIYLELQIKSHMKKVCSFMFSYLTSKSQHFYPNHRLKNIKIISATHKLDLPTDLLLTNLPNGDKSNRPKRKLLAEEHCPLILEHTNNFCEKNKIWLDFYNSQKQKHDLADCFLQGLWIILKSVNKTKNTSDNDNNRMLEITKDYNINNRNDEKNISNITKSSIKIKKIKVTKHDISINECNE